MALASGTVFEVRTTGSQNNSGGFYDRTPGTSVDYSQQDSAQLTLTDLACVQASTTLTSATGGFTEAMEGNLIHITAGTNFTAGWYEVVDYTDTNTVTLDRTAATAGNGSSGTGYVGGAFKIGGSLDDDFANALVAGNTVYIKAGTYSLGESVSGANDGTAASPIIIYGYNSSRGDAPTGDNRPLIQCGAYRFEVITYWQCHHLRFTGSGDGVIKHKDYSIIRNCKVENSSASANKYAISGQRSFIVECEVVCTNGYAMQIGYEGHTLLCYIHDSNIGIDITGDRGSIINCVIDTCSTTGIDLTTHKELLIFSNTIYSCGNGIAGTNAYSNAIFNNIISGCTTGANWSSSIGQNHWDYNCWNNTTDVTNVTKGSNAVTADPLLKDPGNGDFTLDTDSPCFNAGMQLGTIVGL